MSGDEKTPVEKLLARFTHGDRAVGKPVPLADGSRAYTKAQARILFDNLVECEIDGQKLPYVVSHEVG